jgi:hypothetical protein
VAIAAVEEVVATAEAVVIIRTAIVNHVINFKCLQFYKRC